jgi:DNA-binding MarR family transcriptional regulator
LIVRVAEAIDRCFSARLRPLKLRPRQLHVLRYLDAAGTISQTELAEGINVDAANLVETLDELEAAGLTRRAVDPNDRRRRRISLTSAGLRKLRAGRRAAEQADRDVLGTLTRQQLVSLRKAMLRAYHQSRPKP